MKKLCLPMAILGMMAMITAPASAYQAAATETFAYGDGQLVGQGPWLGNAAANTIRVNTGELVVQMGDTANTSATWDMADYSTTGGKIIVKVDVAKGNYVEDPLYPGASDNHWNLFLTDASGANFGKWYGGATMIRGRIGADINATAVYNFEDALFHTYTIAIDTNADTIEYFRGATSMGSYSYGFNGSALSSIKFESTNRGYNTSDIRFDNLSYGNVPEPSSFLALGTFGLGALGFIRRRRA